MSDAPETVWIYSYEDEDFPDVIGQCVGKIEHAFPSCREFIRSDKILDLEAKLDTAMKLLRDNQSPMHLDRELNQADHDILRDARKWR